jgi:glycosyltransferase involved in cell wall biosynthesis
VRIGLDATPLLGRMTGVGTYTSNLLGALAHDWPQDEFVATAFTWRGRGSLGAVVPARVMVRSRPAPARALRAAWASVGQPPVEALSGAVDVFHGTNFVLPPVRRAAGVVTVHDLSFLRYPQTVSSASLAYRELVPVSLGRAAVVLCPSRAVAEQIQDAYAVPPECILVTPLGVDPQWSVAVPATPSWRAERGIPSDYLLAVGTLEPRKNLRALVAAYAGLVADRADVPPLVIAGGAGWGDELDLRSIPRGRVILTGHLELAQLRSLVAGATLLAFPSIDEGFGLPPLEALACGVPVVANDLPVTREVLGDQADFCDAGDPPALAEALLAAVTDPHGTGDSRRAHAAEFTWSRCAAETHSAYLRAVALRG